MLGVNAVFILEEMYERGYCDESVAKVVKFLGRHNPNNHQARSFYKDYLAAPDLIRDTCIDMPWGIPDLYEFMGYGLSAFQHFAVPYELIESDPDGYCWDRDDSLDYLQLTGDALMTLASSNVKYNHKAREWGFYGDILKNSPMGKYISSRPHKIDLDDFKFPSAVEVGAYYGDTVFPNQSIRTWWARAAGFTCHFLKDVLCVHHSLGYLLSGHREWETQLEWHWNSRFTTTDQEAIKRQLGNVIDSVVTESTELINTCSTIYELLIDNVEWLQDHMPTRDLKKLALEGKISRRNATDICYRAISSCITALCIMYSSTP